MANKFPGKRSHKPTVDMTFEEHRLHRIYMNAHKKDYAARKKQKFIGPPKPPGYSRKAKFIGPRLLVKRKKHIRTGEEERARTKRGSENLTDYYIKRRIKLMFKKSKMHILAKDITAEMIKLKRQQLNLWRLVNDTEFT